MVGGGEGRLICAGSGRGREEREIWGEITRGKGKWFAKGKRKRVV